MKRLALASVLLGLPAQAADLGIVVTGLLPETGDVRVVVTPEANPGEAAPESVQALAANRVGGQASTRFTGLEPGEYRVVVLDGSARAVGQGRVSVAEPAATASVALAPVSPGDVPVHPNAVEWHRRLR